MKIAHQFRAFLDSHHYLILPQIGKFESISVKSNLLAGEINKNFVQFISNSEANATAELITFISKNLKIDSSIVESDLNSFCNSVKELLLQGFEAEIPGIGFLHADSKNHLIFSGKSIYNSAEQKIKKKPVIILDSSFWL